MLYDELCSLTNELETYANLAQREVRKINDKGDLTPNEVDSVYKIACTMEKVTKMSNELGLLDGGYSQGGYMPDYRHYDEPMGNSYRRGRSMTTGRYVSRDEGPRMHGYSGHSINDRMIAALEEQMDSATTEYERQQVREEIDRLRMGNNR